MSDTVFAKIIRRELPATILYEDELVVAFRDISPQAPVHVLIVPKKVLPTLNDATEDDRLLLGHILLVARKIAQEEGIAEKGYRLVINTNPDGGQTVFHLHCHLLGGRPMGWPPG
ncbi:MAG: histidine triad nucleotide-binding protein [Bacteroidota bacterium]|nr:histidine triad nucleotide-binding protein [Candidatus Kapabacteria bacterium]MCS7301811.1 histidine triad nucleotide-binding protein [Candidatus Kapabacteria bacterium]MCX7929933.1 histidine triad nucleotide-binding protein [Chlorobiota bacterium]MDW8075042.1 histidine triad nucleotide-binding protein [Bacteroidota bacterium]MDW8271681.1 histidine triad nucleotide-binding protein [Bacteroidota bacterium]